MRTSAITTTTTTTTTVATLHSLLRTSALPDAHSTLLADW
jgi:hypothetical protein